MTLRELKIGESAVVTQLGGEGALRQHFLDMGMIPGAEVTVQKMAPMGDPMELKIHGYELTLRLADAEKIQVEKISEKREHPLPEKKHFKREHPGLGEGGKYHEKSSEHPLPDGTVLTYALVGNQNCGKTTLFNQLTGSNQHVGKDDLTADLEKVRTEEEAKRIAAACEKKQAVVSSLRQEAKTVNPPKLYDLTTLQREANRYYGFTAQQTLDLVQTLYEKKLLTYPRTDSQFITDDMEDTARQVISIVCRQLPLFSGVSLTPDISRVTDNSKVTDHHAILPTVQLEKQDVSALPQSEQKILNLVGMRLLCATGEKHTYAETQISLSCEGYEFKTKGKTVVQNGWKAIEELFKSSLKTKEKDDPMKSLPEVHEGDVLDSVSASVTEHFTTPPKQYTDVICYERGIRNRP